MYLSFSVAVSSATYHCPLPQKNLFHTKILQEVETLRIEKIHCVETFEHERQQMTESHEMVSTFGSLNIMILNLESVIP